MNQRIKPSHIEEASRTVDPVFLNSPQFHAESLSEVLGCELVVKVENMNPICSFKGRGADYFFVRNPDIKEVVCASAGNFGQGIAYAARKRKAKSIVFASEKANPLKLWRMKSFGADVRLHGADFDAAKLAGKDYAKQNGLHFVEDSRDTEFTEGAGTMAVELLRYPKAFDAFVVPLGNGAMIAGIARYVKEKSPQTKVIGVCAAGAPAMEQSWRANTFIQTEKVATIADGIGVRVPVPEALEDIKGLVDDILLVEDSQTIEAMKLAHQHLGVVLEPSGAVGIAAIMNNKTFFSKQRIATILCGGNLTSEQIKQWLH
ncbi:MAG: threonine ammonia-lyase [Trueperaceae bacterium]